MGKKTNLDVLVERERDWVVDILADTPVCDYCVYRGTCDEFTLVYRETCVEGNRKWLLEPYVQGRPIAFVTLGGGEMHGGLL